MPDFPERIRSLQPLWGVWYLDAPLGEGGFGKVYRVWREERGVRYYAAVKWITVPANPAEINSLRANGVDDMNIRRYLEQQVHEIQREITLMSSLRGNRHVVGYEDHAIIPRRNELGWDILIRMELLTTLSQRMIRGMTVGDVVRMGIDLCDALSTCAKSKIIHRDIKPDNIFINGVGDYKLGDFGVARTMRNEMTNMSVKGTPLYMAPEVYGGQTGDNSVDQYSLGLVMHRMLNAHQPPFAQAFDRMLTHEERSQSFALRLGGKPIPPPLQGSQKLKDIICKACSFQAKKRFASPDDMRRALEETLNDRECAEPLLSMGGPGLNSYRSAMSAQGSRKSKQATPAQPGKKSPAKMLTAIIGGVVALTAVVIAILMFATSSSSDQKPATTTRKASSAVTTVKNDTPTVTQTKKPTAKPKVTATPTKRPTATPKVTATPTKKPTDTPKPTATPTKKPTATPRPTETPKPTESGESTGLLESLGGLFGEDFSEGIGERVAGAFNILSVGAYRIFAAAGDADAQWNLGYAYLTGQGAEQDDDQALEWFRKSADQGSAEGQFFMGYMYANGRSVTKNDKQAVSWYTLSADQGLDLAQNELGVMYFFGYGVTQNDATAMSWFRKAAEQGNMTAQFNLGVMYEEGRGADKNLNMALYWYNLSADQGYEDAQEKVRKLQ